MSFFFLPFFRVEVVAHREGTDDILCRHLDELSRFTVVHLTWLGREEIDTQHPAVEADALLGQAKVAMGGPAWDRLKGWHERGVIERGGGDIDYGEFESFWSKYTFD